MTEEWINSRRQQDQNPSAFFVLNVWKETLPSGYTEWRGKVLHVESNTMSAFEDWPEMVDVIACALAAPTPFTTPALLTETTGNILELEQTGEDRNV